MTEDVSRPGWASVLTATATVFGLLVSSGVVAVVIAGALQWSSVSPSLDNLLPLVALAAGMVLAGRVAVDVAGGRGVLAAVGAAVLVAAVGAALSRTSEAHGDGLEAIQVVEATVAVLVVTGGAALVTARRRSARAVSTDAG